MLTRLLISAISILVTAWLLPGVSCSPWWVSIVVAVVLGLRMRDALPAIIVGVVIAAAIVLGLTYGVSTIF